MTTPILRYNDGSQNPPRLRVQHSLWSLIGLPLNAAPDERMDAGGEVRAGQSGGFEAVECWLDESDEARHKAALDATGLRLVLGHHPYSGRGHTPGP